MARGLLVAAFDYSTAHADEFHDWYDLEHVPERQAVPGFGACERWIAIDRPNVAIATYDLEALDVMRSDAYKAIAYDNLSVWSKRVTSMCTRLLRFEGTQLKPGDLPAPANAGGLLMFATNVAPAAEDDFNAWYNEEHLPDLAAVPGVLAARRYVTGPDPDGSHRYVATYHLETAGVVESAAWETAANSDWTTRMRQNFRDPLRLVARRYVRGQK